MSIIACGECGAPLTAPPLIPIRIIADEEDGTARIAQDLRGIYEHVRDHHPAIWNDKLAAEYTQWRIDHL